MDVTVTEDGAASRFEATVDGEHAGILEYRLSGRVATMPHTLVDPRFEGQGVGSALARVAVDTARERGWRIVPTCWFVAGWLRRHPDELDLVERAG
jgi:predicted GNAT family acetyltransferase